MALDAKKSAARNARPEPIVAAEPPKLPTGELPSGKPQVMVINGARMVIMPEADYTVLIEAARDNIEDLADAADAIEILRRIESGEEETFPFDLVKRLTAAEESGESRIKIMREHRELTQAQLGDAIGSNRLYISQLETGVRKGSIDLLQKIAAALDVSVDLVMPKAQTASAPKPAAAADVFAIAARMGISVNAAHSVFGGETNVDIEAVAADPVGAIADRGGMSREMAEALIEADRSINAAAIGTSVEVRGRDPLPPSGGYVSVGRDPKRPPVTHIVERAPVPPRGVLSVPLGSVRKKK